MVGRMPKHEARGSDEPPRDAEVAPNAAQVPDKEAPTPTSEQRKNKLADDGRQSNLIRRQREAARSYQRWGIFRTVLFFTGAATILSLLFVGPRGDYTVTVLSLLATFVFGFLDYVTSPSPPTSQRARDRGLPKRGPRTRSAYFANVLTFSLLGLLAGAGVYYAALGSVAVKPAQSLTIQNERGLSLGKPAQIVFNRTTPDRNYLGLAISVDDYVGSGDCSTFATATLVPRIGKIRQQPIEVKSLGTATREPSETRISIGGAINDLSIDVFIHTDPGCKLALTVTGATFYGYVV